MTVSNETNKVIVSGNGAANTFSFSPMQVDASTHLKVTKTDANGLQEDISQGSGTNDYSVTGTFPGTGSVVYPASGSTRLQSDETLTIRKDTPFLQGVDLKNQGGYHPEVLERALNRLTHMVQQLQEESDRGVKSNVSDTVELELPSQESRKSKVLGFDATGQFETVDVLPSNVTVTAFMETLLDDADGDAGLTTLGLSANGLALVKATYATMRSLLGLGTVYDKNTGTTDGNVALLGAGNVFPISLLPTTVHNSEITGTVTFDTVAGTTTWQTTVTLAHALGYTPDEVTAKFVNVSGGAIGGFADGEFFTINGSLSDRWNASSNNSGYDSNVGFTYTWDGTNIKWGTKNLGMQNLTLNGGIFTVNEGDWRLDWLCKKY